MTQVDLKSLIDRLGGTAKAGLEAGAANAMSQGHYTVELEHWFLLLLDRGASDFEEVLKQTDTDPRAVRRELEESCRRFHSGNSRPPSLSPVLVDCAKQAWLIASVNHNLGQALSSHLLIACLSDDASTRQLRESAPSLKSLSVDQADAATRGVLGDTTESQEILSPGAGSAAASAGPAAAKPGTAALDQFTVNLTERAKNGEIDPVLGRDSEIRQCVDILMRRRQNNPILTGEAGVGKTAVVEGLALRVASGDVPQPLRNVVVRTLDLGLLQAGASVKGEFENRLRAVIDETKASPVPIITFIDEAHTLIGAGGKEGQGDAANLLKPALARGELRTIAATTWAEYKKYFEKDPALTRRFQVVKVEEPSEEVAIDMMRGISGMLQKHHNVRIGDDAICAAVKLSHRYIPDRQLPDKSVSLLDTACARVALTQLATPARIDDRQRDITQLETNIDLIARENVASGDYDAQLEEMHERLSAAKAELTALTDQWSGEQNLISEYMEVRQRLEDDHHADDSDKLEDTDRSELRSRLKKVQQQLAATQGEEPLMSPQVDANAVADIVANWTGIPVGKMLGDEVVGVMSLRERLSQRVIGQDHALEAIAQVVATSRAGLNDPRKPTGVFMMIGTSGTGKTETALALADLLYGGEQSLTVINMSEFKEEHKVSMLLGSPPGYVGYGEGGVLTEAARRKPYSVILLDEMEKAHPGVQDVFYNLFDKGSIKDGEGRDIDFKNTMIIMTTNAGENAIRAIMNQVEEKPDPEVLLDSIRPELLKTFKPAFLGRCSLITYFPLEDEQLMAICEINMKKIEKRVRARYGAGFQYDDDVLIQIVARCQEADTGARNLENILSRSLLPQLATECLTALGENRAISSIKVGVDEENGAFTFSLES